MVKIFYYQLPLEEIGLLKEEKNLENLDRVYGSTDKKSTKVTKDVLSIVCKKLHVASSYKVSEMVKSVENAYRHMDITLANQLSLAFPKR